MQQIFVKVTKNAASLLFLALMLSVSACTLFSGGPKQDTDRFRDLVIELAANRSLVNVGQPIEFRLTVTNEGNREEVIELRNRPVLDIVVGVSLGQKYLYYRWSDGREITPEMTRLALAPGESKTLEWTWVATQEARQNIIYVGGVVQYEENKSEGATVEICVEGCLRP